MHGICYTTCKNEFHNFIFVEISQQQKKTVAAINIWTHRVRFEQNEYVRKNEEKIKQKSECEVRNISPKILFLVQTK